MNSTTLRDRDGKLVRVGSRVRLLRIVPWLLEISPEEEKSDRLSMVGEIFEVQAIEDGRAHLEKWLNSSPTSFTAYAYDAEAHEIEFAKRSDGPAIAPHAAAEVGRIHRQERHGQESPAKVQALRRGGSWFSHVRRRGPVWAE